MTYMKRRAPS